VTAQVVLRLIDKFFSHLWLYLVPIVLVGAVGVWVATSGEDSYQSWATLKVERDAEVAEVTGSVQDPGFGWETPASATAESMNALLRTQTFVDEVAVAAGLDDMVDAGLLTLDEVRASVAVFADSPRLVKVVGTNGNPDVAHRVAEGAIESYIDSVRANEVRDATVAIEFLQQKLPDYEAAVTEAETDLETWIAAHPDPRAGVNRPIDEQVELDRLQDTIQGREEQLTAVQASIEQQELSVEQKEAEVRQRLGVIDPPQVPFAPQPQLKQAVILILMALIVGCFLSLVAVVIGTVLDRTIRFPGDVKDRLDTRVLAVVPKARLTSAMRRKLETIEQEPQPVTLTAAEGAETTVDPTAAPVPAVDGAAVATASDVLVRSPEQAPRSLADARLKRVN
jgi:uncharacterized protein involved in exopolysaccharide biosynthesis